MVCGREMQMVKGGCDVHIVKTSITIDAVRIFLNSSRHMIQALQTTTPSVRANYRFFIALTNYVSKIMREH